MLNFQIFTVFLGRIISDLPHTLDLVATTGDRGSRGEEQFPLEVSVKAIIKIQDHQQFLSKFTK